MQTDLCLLFPPGTKYPFSISTHLNIFAWTAHQTLYVKDIPCAFRCLHFTTSSPQIIIINPLRFHQIVVVSAPGYHKDGLWSDHPVFRSAHHALQRHTKCYNDLVHQSILRRPRSFSVCNTVLRMCSGSSNTEVVDAKRCYRLIRKACLVLEEELDITKTVVEIRMLPRLRSILDDAAHPLHSAVAGQKSTFIPRVLKIKCSTGHLRKSFLLTTICSYNRWITPVTSAMFLLILIYLCAILTRKCVFCYHSTEPSFYITYLIYYHIYTLINLFLYRNCCVWHCVFMFFSFVYLCTVPSVTTNNFLWDNKSTFSLILILLLVVPFIFCLWCLGGGVWPSGLDSMIMRLLVLIPESAERFYCWALEQGP